MILPLDGPSLQGKQTVTDSTVFRVKYGSSELEERKLVSIMPLTGDIWVYFGDNVSTPSASLVKSDGFYHPEGGLRSYEASDSQEIYIVADSGSVDVRYAERA